jgi:glycosyltransferase involved in cell wall biosynthesis
MPREHESQTVVFVANRGFALTNSRILLIRHFLTAGWRVVVATADDEHARALAGEGAVVEPVRFYRGGAAVGTDVAAFTRLLAIYRRYRPRLVHHFNAKPLILGTAAARLAGTPTVVNTVTGLGHAFIAGTFVRRLAGVGYSLMLNRGDVTIFQNRDDMALFLESGWTTADRSRLIVSSGIDTARFAARQARDETSPSVLMVGRLIWQKGVREYLDAAALVRDKHPRARFRLAGEWDAAHPDAVPAAVVHEATGRGLIEFLGFVTNIEVELARASVVVLPSYREGTPRVILEASASGAAVVAFDVPGCREAVIHGETGLLVPFKDARALAEAVSRLLDDDELRARMGRAGRRMVEERFDLHAITRAQLGVYRDLGVSVA